jgi:hypothetical protein
MKSKITKTAVLFALIAILGGCTKGDKGDTGPAGADGTNGTNGTNGKDGNANVHAFTANIASTNWAWDASSFGNYCDINVPDITSTIVSGGTVSVFFGNSGGGWVALPYTDYPTTSTSYTLNYVYYTGGVTLWLFHSDYTNNTAPFTSARIKVVVIAGSFKQSHPNIKWNNYNEVKPFLSENSSSAAVSAL